MKAPLVSFASLAELFSFGRFPICSLGSTTFLDHARYQKGKNGSLKESQYLYLCSCFRMGEPEPWLRLGNPRETYDIYFNRLVSELAEDFTREETQKLGFIFQKQLPASFREKHGQNALKLLEHLMQKNGLFSSDKPQKLAHLMDLLAFGEKREKVETFIGKTSALK